MQTLHQNEMELLLTEFIATSWSDQLEQQLDQQQSAVNHELAQDYKILNFKMP